MLKLYVKLKMLIIKICNIIKLLRFSFYLYYQNLFRDGDPQLVLRVIQGYINLESQNYKNSIVYGRTVDTSVKLLSTLIDEYFESKSDKTLDQILEVLKVEFIKRNVKNVK